MKARILIVAICFLLTGCVSKEYQVQMAAGEQALSERNYEEAARAYSTALEAGPPDREAEKKLLEIDKLKLEGEVQETLDAGKQAYQGKRYELAISTLSDILAKHEGNFDVRPLIVETKLTLAQVTFDFRLSSGKQHLEDGRYQDAIQSFNLALQQRPYDKVIKGLKQTAVLKQKELTRDSVRLHHWTRRLDALE
ncbi:tetratricopeptide repeat protein [Paenibacillus sp. strain BS8-2]